jgi:hypothetical protein
MQLNYSIMAFSLASLTILPGWQYEAKETSLFAKAF